MRSDWRTLVATVTGLLMAPQLVAAEDVQEQLQRMQERMSQLEDKLNATSDELAATKQRADAQQKVIQEAGLAHSRSAASGLSRFLEQTEFAGWVTASYFYNTSGPDSGEGANVGSFGTANPFHPDHNSFQLDQLWFSMEKPVSPESRAGFAADILYGKTADWLRREDSMNGDLPAVHQAYVQYLAPIGAGITVKAGRFATLIGAEVAETPYNFNITRGLVYATLQPINHVGLLLSSEYDSGVDWALGVANTSLLNKNTDTDNDKALLWHLGFAPDDTLALGVSGVWGGDHPLGDDFGVSGAGRKDDKTGIVDFVLNWDPSDALSTWVNFDYVWSQEDRAGWDPEAFGVAAAGRLALTDRTGVAMRGEFIQSYDQFLYHGGGRTNQRLWSITGTLDHSLTDNLLLRIEVRYEEGRQEAGPDEFYLDDEDDDGDEEQVLVGAELTYIF